MREEDKEAAFDPVAKAMSDRKSMAAVTNYKRQTGVRSQCILSGNLETLSFGSMNIELDNSYTSVASNETVSGKVKIDLTQPIAARGITLNLCGKLVSQFMATETT